MRFAAIPDFLPVEKFRDLQRAVQADLQSRRVHIPGHKRGATISYSELDLRIPEVTSFYRSAELRHFLSDLLKLSVNPTPLHDQSSCSILIYDRPGDRIGWHYDHNFYNGRHFTVLLPLLNEGVPPGNLSSSRLLISESGEVRAVPTPANRLVIFEGAFVRHAVTALGANERRIILSMTFCSDSSTTHTKDLMRRFKDIAYFGLPAIWK